MGRIWLALQSVTHVNDGNTYANFSQYTCLGPPAKANKVPWTQILSRTGLTLRQLQIIIIEPKKEPTLAPNQTAEPLRLLNLKKTGSGHYEVNNNNKTRKFTALKSMIEKNPKLTCKQLEQRVPRWTSMSSKRCTCW